MTLLDAPADSRIVYSFHCYDPIIFTHQTAQWIKGMPKDFHIAYPDTLANYRRWSAAFSKEYIGSLLHEGLTDVETSFFEANLSAAISAAEKYDVPLLLRLSTVSFIRQIWKALCIGIRLFPLYLKSTTSDGLPGHIKKWTSV